SSLQKKLPILRKELMSSLVLGNNPKSRPLSSVLGRTPGTRFSRQAVKRTPYTRRNNMGPCMAKFGKVTVFIGYLENALRGKMYRVARRSMKCYLKGVNYQLVTVNLENDERTKEKCQKYKMYLFKRHCIAAEYLKNTDWMLVLDADTGVVNPSHCIEEWIDDRVDVLVYERFFNSEISAASFMVRNSKFGRDFLMKWADREFTLHEGWNGLDNGVLHLHVLDTLIPDAIQERKNCHDVWLNATSYDTYMAVVSCVRQALGATHLWPGKSRFYRKAHGWVRDGYLADGKTELASFGKYLGETYPSYGKQVFFLAMPVIGECYPDCERLT
uniref:Glyco_transf_64 domain-containing protein n=1 Tax=Haemonchus contortus TaxID=6289 RepID=A0A7I4YCU5_HAECO